MFVTLLIIHVLLSLALIGLVLIQQGKGADAGAAFGSGASATVFGSQGSGSFLTRLTTGIAIAFFATSLGLAYISTQNAGDAGVIDRIEEAQQEVAEPTAESEGSEIPDFEAEAESAAAGEEQATP